MSLDELERTSSGGFVIERTDEHVITVERMMFNWRLYVGLPEMENRTYEHGYCYFGTDAIAMHTAIAAGQNWPDPLNKDPFGFDKKAF